MSDPTVPLEPAKRARKGNRKTRTLCSRVARKLSAQNHKIPAVNKAEGDKTVTVKKAEADAEGLYLAGVGVGRSNQVLVKGMA